MEETKNEDKGRETQSLTKKPDVLQQASLNYEKLTKTEYVYTLGTKDKRSVVIEFIGCNSDAFTHIYGLDHLTDVKDFANLKNRGAAKKKIYAKIQKGEYPLSELLKNSNILTAPLPKTYNPETKKEFSIYDRILALEDLESILDNVENVSMYRWDNQKSKIVCPNGQKRITNINADTLLVIPAKKDVNYYLFAYKQKSINPKEPLRLKIFSAFIDGVDLTMGQGKPFPILKVDKVTNKGKDVKTLYVHPNYEI